MQKEKFKADDNAGLVLSVLEVTFPFFALVLCGYLAAHRRMLPLEAIPGLNLFVLYFALPCMLYRFGANTPLAQLFDPVVAGIWLVCALLVVGLTIALTLTERIRWNDASFGALVAAFPNTGFMGVPLLVALLGTQAAGPTILTIAVDMIVTTSLCIALSRLDAAGTHGAAAAVRGALRGVMANPMAWAILLGGAASAASFVLPGPLDKTVNLLADAASPVALFTIGAVLARSQLLVASRQTDAAQSSTSPFAGDVVPIAVIKLVLHPLLVYFIGSMAMRLGVPLADFALTVMVLMAALPSASNVVLLSERFGADTGRIAGIILVTTTVAFLSFSGAVRLMS